MVVGLSLNFNFVVRLLTTFTLVATAFWYPIISATTVYIPGGTSMIMKNPSSSAAAPIVVPSITILAPIRGSPLSASTTVPTILPPVCACTPPIAIPSKMISHALINKGKLKNCFWPTCFFMAKLRVFIYHQFRLCSIILNTYRYPFQGTGNMKFRDPGHGAGFHQRNGRINR